VFADGDANARLMFVGEGPGADEDASGVPFVGRAGQLLNNMIQAMGLKREQVYIANIVKCRPPANRVPEPLEANTCDQFLLQQIDVVQPEVIVALESIRAFVRAAEADAAPNASGVMTPRWEPLNAARNWYPKLYQRFPEILRKLGASGLMATPTEADVNGPAGEDIDTYLQAATLSGRDRVRLFRLVWDACASAFAGRQALYEYYFFGDPVRMATAYQASYDKAPYADRVRAFLDRDY